MSETTSFQKALPGRHGIETTQQEFSDDFANLWNLHLFPVLRKYDTHHGLDVLSRQTKDFVCALEEQIVSLNILLIKHNVDAVIAPDIIHSVNDRMRRRFMKKTRRLGFHSIGRTYSSLAPELGLLLPHQRFTFVLMLRQIQVYSQTKKFLQLLIFDILKGIIWFYDPLYEKTKCTPKAVYRLAKAMDHRMWYQWDLWIHVAPYAEDKKYGHAYHCMHAMVQALRFGHMPKLPEDAQSKYAATPPVTDVEDGAEQVSPTALASTAKCPEDVQDKDTTSSSFQQEGDTAECPSPPDNTPLTPSAGSEAPLSGEEEDETENEPYAPTNTPVSAESVSQGQQTDDTSMSDEDEGPQAVSSPLPSDGEIPPSTFRPQDFVSLDLNPDGITFIDDREGRFAVETDGEGSDFENVLLVYQEDEAANLTPKEGAILMTEEQAAPFLPQAEMPEQPQVELVESMELVTEDPYIIGITPADNTLELPLGPLPEGMAIDEIIPLPPEMEASLSEGMAHLMDPRIESMEPAKEQQQQEKAASAVTPQIIPVTGITPSSEEGEKASVPLPTAAVVGQESQKKAVPAETAQAEAQENIPVTGITVSCEEGAMASLPLPTASLPGKEGSVPQQAEGLLLTSADEIDDPDLACCILQKAKDYKIIDSDATLSPWSEDNGEEEDIFVSSSGTSPSMASDDSEWLPKKSSSAKSVLRGKKKKRFSSPVSVKGGAVTVSEWELGTGTSTPTGESSSSGDEAQLPVITEREKEILQAAHNRSDSSIVFMPKKRGRPKKTAKSDSDVSDWFACFLQQTEIRKRKTESRKQTRLRREEELKKLRPPDQDSD